ncbi:MAG TPA: hypothetical protein ENN43_01405 [bacterium]|nr:hypothetical protein [bacterium]
MEKKEGSNTIKPTIVGVRPPEDKVDFIRRPIGIEILLKKASVDPVFREKLIKERGAAAEAIAMMLDPSEEAVLSSISEEQLGKMIDNSGVSSEQRPAFEKYTAALMIAVFGAYSCVCRGLQREKGTF